jgi:hypothetical protein
MQCSLMRRVTNLHKSNVTAWMDYVGRDRGGRRVGQAIGDSRPHLVWSTAPSRIQPDAWVRLPARDGPRAHVAALQLSTTISFVHISSWQFEVQATAAGTWRRFSSLPALWHLANGCLHPGRGVRGPLIRGERRAGAQRLCRACLTAPLFSHCSKHTSRQACARRASDGG